MLAASPVRVKQPCSWRGCCPHASHALLAEGSSAVKGSVSLLVPLLVLLWQDACQHRLSPGHHSLRVSPIPKCSFWLETQGCVFTECSFASVYQSYCGGTMTHGAQREPCHLSGRAQSPPQRYLLWLHSWLSQIWSLCVTHTQYPIFFGK